MRCQTLFAAALAVTLTATGVAAAEPNRNIPAISQVNGVKPAAAIFQEASVKAPAIIRTETDAHKYFSDDDFNTLTKMVDLKQQVVLVFAWRGSGQDEMQWRVAESSPEQVFFTLKPGRTKDLRPHTKIYALRSNVKWSVQ